MGSFCPPSLSKKNILSNPSLGLAVQPEFQTHSLPQLVCFGLVYTSNHHDTILLLLFSLVTASSVSFVCFCFVGHHSIPCPQHQQGHHHHVPSHPAVLCVGLLGGGTARHGIHRPASPPLFVSPPP
ncbi:hypothetical protein GPALN_006378 [Globodera pallida]|nr:hypothetical protein GPALN_006378 [Globodera pallida]